VSRASGFDAAGGTVAGICEAALENEPKACGYAGFDTTERVAKLDQPPSGTLPIVLDCLAPHGSDAAGGEPAAHRTRLKLEEELVGDG
jgi:hypothetical protein